MLRIAAFTLLLVCGSLLRPHISLAEKPFELWVHPFFSAKEIIKRFKPLTNYLGNRLGHSVIVAVSKSYQSHIVRVGEDRIDMAYMGPAPYVKMTDQFGEKPLLATIEVKGNTSFHGMIVIRSDSEFTELSQLAGTKFAFGDKNSTMSHVVPVFMLQQAGVGLDDLAGYSFLKSHRNVALGVLGGYYDAGAVKESVYGIYKARGLKVLAVSPAIPSHLFLVRSDFPSDKIKDLRKAFLELPQAEQGYTIMNAIKPQVSGMRPVTDSDYNNLRKIMARIKTKP